jgi:hypothetical protein
MKTITIKFEVFGNSHQELLENADREISEYLGLVDDDDDDDDELFLDIEEEPIDHNISYEMIVKKCYEDFGKYSAEVVGRFKNE